MGIASEDGSWRRKYLQCHFFHNIYYRILCFAGFVFRAEAQRFRRGRRDKEKTSCCKYLQGTFSLKTLCVLCEISAPLREIRNSITSLHYRARFDIAVRADQSQRRAIRRRRGQDHALRFQTAHFAWREISDDDNRLTDQRFGIEMLG